MFLFRVTHHWCRVTGRAIKPTLERWCSETGPIHCGDAAAELIQSRGSENRGRLVGPQQGAKDGPG